jgi:hypothetical protein
LEKSLRRGGSVGWCWRGIERKEKEKREEGKRRKKENDQARERA